MARVAFSCLVFIVAIVIPAFAQPIDGQWATEFFVEGPNTPPEYTVSYQGRLVIVGNFIAAGDGGNTWE
jgi:hypothetical protein